MEVTTESGLQVVMERARPVAANANGEMPTVTPSIGGGPVMGAWGTNDILPPPTTPWSGWPINWGTTWGGAGLGQRVGVAMTCADLNGRVLSTMPTYVMRERDKTMIPSPAWMSNPEPSLYVGWEEACRQLIDSLQLRGEAFLYCTGRYASPNGITPGQVSRWAILSPDATGVQVRDGAIEYRYNGELLATRSPGQSISTVDVLHLKYRSWPNLLRGFGPLEWTAANAIGAAALESYTANMASRGGIPWAVLHSKRNLNGDQTRDLQQAWVSAAAQRNGAPAVLAGDLDLQILQMSPKDMALLDLRVFDEQRIAAAFGVPAYLVGLPQANGLVYANAESLFMYHWRAMLRTTAQSIASALSSWALPIGSTMEFNPEKYIEPPMAERAATYNVLFNIYDPVTGERAITIPEIRARERFSPGDAESAMELTGV